MGLIRRHWRSAAFGALLLAAVVNLFLTNRPPAFYKMLQVTEIETLPDTPALADVRRYTQIGAGFIPKMGLVQWPRADLSTRPVKVGWVYEERGFLGMPYSAVDVSNGPSLYIDTGNGYQLAGVGPSQIALLEEKVGRPFLRDYRFAWYWHVWGWLYPPLLAIFGWLWLRERRRREEASWDEEATL